MLKINIKKLHKNAVIPSYAKPGDAGMDLIATEIEDLDHTTYKEIPKQKIKCGLAIEIPEGYVGLIFPRSSIYKTNRILANSVGVIDSGYRGEISAIFYKTEVDDSSKGYKVGERFAQLIIIPYPQISFNEVDELSTTKRGEGGFGSTGK